MKILVQFSHGGEVTRHQLSASPGDYVSSIKEALAKEGPLVNLIARYNGPYSPEIHLIRVALT